MTQLIEYEERRLYEAEQAMPEKDRWENLTIQNSFMFAKVMSNEELCTELLRRIFPDLNIGYVQIVQTEKAFETGWDSRGIRLDVYAESGQRIFDAEMQAQNTHTLPKRSRYYHGTIDVTNLEKGLDYDELQDTYVIFICPFDPFTAGRHLYTFRNLCTEDPSLELKDGTTTVFLNASGLIDDVSPKLKAFLDYVSGSPASKIGDDFVVKLEEHLDRARKNKDWRREFMMGSIYERDAYLRGENKGLEKGREEGREEGRQEILSAIIAKLKSSGISVPEINELLEGYCTVNEDVAGFLVAKKE